MLVAVASDTWYRHMVICSILQHIYNGLKTNMALLLLSH